ncbi:hypothetical protein A2U01_0108342, partial [Trifolium medium]|nr:hypothetical protein [Trifolium medium]
HPLGVPKCLQFVEAVQDGSQKVRRRRGKQGRASTVTAGSVPVVDEGHDGALLPVQRGGSNRSEAGYNNGSST